MGQYYKVVNLDRREYLNPHDLGDGFKLLEFACGSAGTMTALAVLLADGNGRGGGDLISRRQNEASEEWRENLPSTGSIPPYPDEMAKPDDPVGKVAGRWAGGRIVVAGDYADDGHLVPKDLLAQWIQDGYGAEHYPAGHQDRIPSLYVVAEYYFENISLLALRAIAEDQWIRPDINRPWSSDPKVLAAYQEILGDEDPKNESTMRPDMVIVREGEMR